MPDEETIEETIENGSGTVTRCMKTAKCYGNKSLSLIPLHVFCLGEIILIDHYRE